jgi:hypothetical protein
MRRRSPGNIPARKKDDCQRQMHRELQKDAALEGNALRFAKIYDGFGHTVLYKGVVSGGQVTGFWRARTLTGEFRMTRRHDR